ncbi:hypothetical protein N4E61_15000, partial [Staphylococcus aureus]|nr:hypothetical protein [Staphylococcus aureus]
MISGIAIAAKSLVPGIKVFGAEPLQADDARRSILQGAIAQHRPGCPNTMADGLLTTLAPRSFQA